MRTRRGLVVGSFALLALSGRARAEEADAETRARIHFQTGVEAIERGELGRAADEFEAAQALSPNPIVLYNLGQAYSAMGRAVEAEHAFRLYLESAPRPLAPEREREVEELIRLNTQRIGSVVLELVPENAALEADGSKLTGADPAGHWRLTAGRHVLVATSAGYKPSVVNLDVRGGEELRLRVELEALPASNAAVAAAAPPARSAAPPPAPVSSATGGITTAGVAGIVMTGVGGAALVLSGIFALDANSTNKESNRNGHCDASGCDPEGLALRATAQHAGNWATGLFIGGAAVAAAGVTLYLVAGRAPADPKTSSLRLRLTLDTAHAGVALAGGFD